MKSNCHVFPCCLNNQPRDQWSNDTRQCKYRHDNTQNSPAVCCRRHRRDDGQQDGDRNTDEDEVKKMTAPSAEGTLTARYRQRALAMSKALTRYTYDRRLLPVWWKTRSANAPKAMKAIASYKIGKRDPCKVEGITELEVTHSDQVDRVPTEQRTGPKTLNPARVEKITVQEKMMGRICDQGIQG